MKTYIAELEKLNPAGFTMLKKSTEEDKILLFCKKDISLSIDQFMQLNALTPTPEFITAESEAERCFYAGVAYASGKAVFVTNFALPKTVQSIISGSGPTKKRATRTKKNDVKDLAEAKADVEAAIDSNSTVAKTKTAKSTPVRQKTLAEPKKNIETPKKVVPKQNNPTEKDADTEAPAKKKKEPPIWADSASEGFYKKFCTLPKETKDYEEIIHDTAKIFAESSDGNIALKEIKKKYGSGISSYFASNVNILLTCIYDGLSKQIQL